MSKTLEKKEQVVIKFAGDSGDGMQLIGGQFTDSTALAGHDLGTFPDFPAEIRAPAGTLAGVSGFQLHFGSLEINTPGDDYDVLVAMNAAALKSNIKILKKGGAVIVNTAGFDDKNLRLSTYDKNPLEDNSLDDYRVFEIDITKLTRESLEDIELGMRDKDRCKNMFVLGFVYWMYNRSLDTTIEFLNKKFAKMKDVLEANLKVLKAGYNYGDTTETFTTRYEIDPAKIEAGTYRSIMGNQAVTLGLIVASKKSGLPLFYGSYPITPATDILHELVKYKNWGVKTFQAEDEIAAICSVIGAAFGGSLGVTGTSGPGLALKSEALGLAVILEMPLVLCNIQRAGPSTGMPTKTEQADLMQAMYGRNGESPLPILAASSPADCFETIFEACRIALEHMTPVIFLSDGYIANGAEPWKFPKEKDIPDINIEFVKQKNNGELFQPYKRDDKLVRPWAIPGTKGLEHRLGGLEKENITGNISYDPENHEFMVKLREEKIERIADSIPEQKISIGPEKGDLLILGWGSTSGVIRSVVRDVLTDGYKVAHAHLRYLKPFPSNLDVLFKNYKQVLIPEINNGQLIKIIRDRYLIDAIGYDKIRGLPISKSDLRQKVLELLK